MEVKIDGDKLVISMPIHKERSTSGKSVLVASTHGNIPTMVQVDGKPLTVSVNCYIKA